MSEIVRDIFAVNCNVEQGKARQLYLYAAYFTGTWMNVFSWRSGMNGFLEQLVGRVEGSLAGDSGLGLDTTVKSLLSGDTINAMMAQAEKIGLQDQVRSWISKEDNNLPVSVEQIRSLLNDDTVQALVNKTGLSAETLLPALAKFLPEAVDKNTPEGKVEA